MSDIKSYSLYVSHSWTYGNAYTRLLEFFAEDPLFRWRSYGISKHSPLHDSPNIAALEEAIRGQMREANGLLIMAGMYLIYSKWIHLEMEIAKELGKPILAVIPWGEDKIADSVRENATEVVAWGATSVVDAIRRNVMANDYVPENRRGKKTAK